MCQHRSKIGLQLGAIDRSCKKYCAHLQVVHQIPDQYTQAKLIEVISQRIRVWF